MVSTWVAVTELSEDLVSSVEMHPTLFGLVWDAWHYQIEREGYQPAPGCLWIRIVQDPPPWIVERYPGEWDNNRFRWWLRADGPVFDP